MKHILFSIVLLLITVLSFGQSATVTLASTATPDPKGTITTYLWTEVSGATVQTSDVTKNSLTITFSTAGNYVFSCTATDNQGQTVATNAYVSISSYSNAKPTIIILPASTPTNPIIAGLK